MMDDTAAALGILAVLGGFIFIVVLIAIACYVLMALGLYKLAKNRGIENPWLAWIPIAQYYTLGKLIGSLNIGGWQVPTVELFLPIGALVVMFLNWIPVIGWLLSLAYFVLYLFAIYKLYKMYRPQSAVLWLVLSIIFPFMGAIFLFVMRNDSPVTTDGTFAA